MGLGTVLVAEREVVPAQAPAPVQVAVRDLAQSGAAQTAVSVMAALTAAIQVEIRLRLRASQGLRGRVPQNSILGSA